MVETIKKERNALTLKAVMRRIKKRMQRRTIMMDMRLLFCILHGTQFKR
jgi:hypothetical protein